jgi:hypothetical protein
LVDFEPTPGTAATAVAAVAAVAVAEEEEEEEEGLFMAISMSEVDARHDRATPPDATAL